MEGPTTKHGGALEGNQLEEDVKVRDFIYLYVFWVKTHFCFQDFQGFLNDLQDWELLKDTDKKMKKSQASDMVKFQF